MLHEIMITAHTRPLFVKLIPLQCSLFYRTYDGGVIKLSASIPSPINDSHPVHGYTNIITQNSAPYYMSVETVSISILNTTFTVVLFWYVTE